jgi:6,7-dimethyl-8-ribityllumazine synthase
MNRIDEPERDDEERAFGADPALELERASENVLDPWPSPSADEADPPAEEPADEPAAEWEPPSPDAEAPAGAPVAEPADLVEPSELDDPAIEAAAVEERVEASSEHAPGELVIPPGYAVLEGRPDGRRRAVGLVVSRFNGEVTGALLESALAELEARGVGPDSITVMPVPGAFELPIAAMALAKTRRFACIVALGCVIRGDTPHFDYVASEAASGLQLAAIETGVPVAFGVLTLDRPDQAEPRLAKGAEAVETALEMADLFANLRAAAAR